MGNLLFDGGDSSQPYLIFQKEYRYFKTVTNSNYILSWKSKGFSAECIRSPTTSDNILNPELCYIEYNKYKIKIYWKLFKTIKNHIYL